MRLILAAFMSFVVAGSALPADLLILPEFRRPTPFGGVVAADAIPDSPRPAKTKTAYLAETARNAYVSFHLVVDLPAGGDYEVSVQITDPTRKLEIDLFREWFHFTGSDRSYYPDALVPVSMPYRTRLPDPDNRIEKQTSAAYWVDVWVPKEAKPGVYRGMALLRVGRKETKLPFELRVVEATVPEEDVVTIDHNSYGSSWLADYYGGIAVPSDQSFQLTHLYHRLFYEHRGIFHQLGYGHGGKVIAEFAPELEGSGRTKRIKNWDLYDRHYGPLLDGSAFAGSRRGPRPIPFVYLPINPEWPASFLWWGEPGYEAEFVNVVAQMEQHFRQKGWTQTRFEMFFNHKKRYKAFPWDGDETRFPEDDNYFREYGRLLRKALPPETPVKFVFRNDASWAMERQFESLAGVVDFWVCGGSIFSWYPQAPRLLKGRGDIVWLYGGAPDVTKVSTAITENPLRVWLYGVDGWVHWLTTNPGADPWFAFNGGAEVLAYPGERFGIRGPIPSVRLKLQRNCVQDLALLDSFKARVPIETLKAAAARHFNNSEPKDWWIPRPPLADEPPYEWTNATIEDAVTAGGQRKFDSSAWDNVRRYILQLAREEK
ncbi:MAG TPA: DUF4091 domain-containing protein [Acidobacteriota bacterium]|nr:DUF4091 domain-containing protein [Acidobacteriota bacterium]